MEKADGGNGVKAVLEGCEGGRLGQEHEQSVQTFVEVGIAFWF